MSSSSLRASCARPGLLLVCLLCLLLALLAPLGRPASAAPGSPASILAQTEAVDWGKAVVDSTMQRYPTASSLGSWGYAKALFLYGAYLVYQRTHDSRYLAYIKSWVDMHVDSSGNISNSFNNLDAMLPGNLLLILHQETGQSRYKIAADKIRTRFNTYPRTSDGGFWHATGSSRAGQLWLDGVYMSMPFLARYGKRYNDATYANNEAAKQLLVYASHLKHASNGLLYHAYDEQGDTTWSNNTLRRSSEFWCRSIGWFGMATIEVLEEMPATHARRAELVSLIQNLVRGYTTYQDSQTGRWFQVVDKGSLSNNWTETSCSSMYSYVISRAVERGYVDASYNTVALKGFQGVLQKISLGSDGLTNLVDICIGTNVGDLAYYLARERSSNDFHGLGAFLIMYEQLIKPVGPTPTPTRTRTPTGPTATRTRTPTLVPALMLSNLNVRDSTNAADWSLQTNIQNGSSPYGDRAYSVEGLPATLAGSQWVRPAADSKAYAGNPLVSFSISRQADVYVSLDDRLGRPSWLDGTWLDTGTDLTIRESSTTTRVQSLYRKTFAAGTVALGPLATTSVPTYLVIVK